MKKSTTDILLGVLGLAGTALAAGTTVSYIRNSDASSSSKLIATAAGAAAGACAIDNALKLYTRGIEQKAIENEIEKRIKEEITGEK